MNRRAEQQQGIVDLREDPYPNEPGLRTNNWELQRLQMERLRLEIQLLQRQQTHTELHSRQVANRRSTFVIAFAGCFVVGGAAACTVAASPVVAAAGLGAMVAGTLGQVAGVLGYVRTYGGGINNGR